MPLAELPCQCYHWKMTLTTWPRNPAQHAMLQRILQSALQAADPALALHRFVRLDGTRLLVDERAYELQAYRHIHLLSFGKAGDRLARALYELLGTLLYRGLVIAKKAQPFPPGGFDVIEAGHPMPDERSLRAGRTVMDFLQDVGPNDLLICALSGGASSLVSLPRSPIDLKMLQGLTARLLACGANIREINTLRRHLDVLKGGGLLRHTQAAVIGLILSDVTGDSLEDIGSGPTAPDPSTREQALSILRKYNLSAACPAELLSSIKNGPETLKPQDARLANVQNLVIGSNLLAVQAALRQAAREGLHPHGPGPALAGEARQVAQVLCRALRLACEDGQPVSRPFCMVAGGETTVTLQGAGRGGRNTELALAAVTELAGLQDVLLVTLATDGEDGPTDAAGALVSGESWQRAKALGLDDPQTYLDRNDSYAFFAALGDLVKTGPTGTNVNDLVLMFGF